MTFLEAVLVVGGGGGGGGGLKITAGGPLQKGCPFMVYPEDLSRGCFLLFASPHTSAGVSRLTWNPPSPSYSPE